MTKTFVLVGDDFPAAQTLDLLLRADSDVAMAFSTTCGNGLGPLEVVAGKHHVPIYPADELGKPAGLQLLSRHPFDWLININATVVLPPSVLECPRAGALNMHPGRLPEYAGLHTHQWAIRNGETEFAATIHFMDMKVDAGDIVSERRFPIERDDTGLKLFMKCIREGTDAMREVLRWIAEGQRLPRRAQDLTRRHLYRLRCAKDGRIDWYWTAAEVERFVRAGNYEPLSSPTYTAYLDPLEFAGESLIIEVLKASIVPGTGMEARPGQVLKSEHGQSVICGDGVAVALERTRIRGCKAALGAADLRRLLPEGTILQGRQACVKELANTAAT